MLYAHSLDAFQPFLFLRELPLREERNWVNLLVSLLLTIPIEFVCHLTHCFFPYCFLLVIIILEFKISNLSLWLSSSKVGYKVRLEGMKGRDTHLLFCTTGILLRKLLSDRNLKGITHVIVDEIHERGMNEGRILIFSDFCFLNSELKMCIFTCLNFFCQIFCLLFLKISFPADQN